MAKIATLSFDDGGTGDLKVMAMLRERKAQGTFYLPSCALVEHWYGGIGRGAIAAAYVGFEIGAHGRLHRHLARDESDVASEVVGCLGDLRWFFDGGLQVKCLAWCYGGHTPAARKMAARCYFYARSISRNDPHAVSKPEDKMLMPITGIFAGNAGIFLGIADNEIPMHVIAHPWEIGLKWDLSALDALVCGLQERGYTLLTNFNFFEETWRARS